MFGDSLFKRPFQEIANHETAIALFSLLIHTRHALAASSSKKTKQQLQRQFPNDKNHGHEKEQHERIAVKACNKLPECTNLGK